MVRTLLWTAIALSLGAAPALADDTPLRLALPSSPTLAAVRPGVQVVESLDEEVFFASGWWWVRRGAAWYRSPSPRLAFVRVETARVPLTVVSLPPGRYVRFREPGATLRPPKVEADCAAR
ncbi:MAG TPA: hypothetical protein VMT17_13695 [Anaeromyxobacteraceae bacterium]|nr:hypothetical protein [Anaeromyxobacteraceae bacterium]